MEVVPNSDIGRGKSSSWSTIMTFPMKVRGIETCVMVGSWASDKRTNGTVTSVVRVTTIVGQIGRGTIVVV